MEEKNTTITFNDLCDTFELISSTKKRLEIQLYLSDFYKKIIIHDKNLLSPVVYLSMAKIAPEHLGIELGVGETTLIKVAAESTNRPLKAIKSEFEKSGDLGVTASKFKLNQLFMFKKKDLTITKVFEDLKAISNEMGSKSTAGKIRLMLGLLAHANKVETKYLFRIFEGKLRIGLALKTVLISLAIATSNGKGDFSEEIKHAYSCRPVFETIISTLLEYGPEDLCKHIDIQPGIPLKPMLAQPIKNLTAAFNRLGDTKFTCEYKYDGERAQIHKSNNEVKIFSRNSEDITEKFPEIVEFIKKEYIESPSFILDSEIVAYDRSKHVILPFQTLAKRKKKNVVIKNIEVDVCIFAFDLIFFKSSMLDKELCMRRDILFNNFKETEGCFKFVEYKNCQTVEEIDFFFNKSIQDNSEGLMIKKIGERSEYMPSKRCFNWIKLKKDYLTGMADTFDLVVLGCYYGKGKRKGIFGGFLMGCLNDEEDVYEVICKLGTGFSEVLLVDLYEKLKNDVINKLPNINYKESTAPDVWVTPKYVWEVEAASFSDSCVYTAGIGYFQDKGVSLRFPRFIRERADKSIDDSTTSSQIVRMFNSAAANGKYENSDDSE